MSTVDVGKKNSAPRVLPHYGNLLFHISSVGVMLKGFMALQDMSISKAVEPQVRFLLYLTIIGLFGSGMVMIFSSISDLLPSVSFVRRLKRSILLFAMPVEIVISSIYWPLVLFRPELMFPPNPVISITPEPSSSPNTDLLFRIPLWMDLSMHAVPGIVLLLDFFLLEPKYRQPASTRGAALLAIIFGTTYSLWIEYASNINGRFPYPFLTVMTLSQRVMMYVISTGLALGAFRFLNWLHR
ncbi:hypothetical protein TREMEDRAFT_30965 [Tremella mesenterica DSM 1558]|uniref:uncharacterized protein n=1 Tax=Tremella mesenterica (strain ATCC 24925 / CBS 8224 / DSM 1558 / NBRC 9311 / NRRL Y-6157 / RJB 2259-6 / UBC 559-6) TaxID=578456 RepID=UPI0003F4930E|nr:uncharacterized protein TREMEDRAFT_30965 [Tremella mesenterica DSM 1558]EIW69504.1 hypothetical protein TREMEDRAFT_30965 [Tremella mesenterica DSM 1558]